MKWKNFSKIVNSLTLVFFFNSICIADDSVKYVDKGVPAPFDGYLLTPQKASDIRKELLEKDALKDINASQQKTIDLYKQNDEYRQKQLNLYSTQNDNLAKSNQELRASNDLQKIVWFGLGILATGLAVYGAKKITQ